MMAEFLKVVAENSLQQASRLRHQFIEMF